MHHEHLPQQPVWSAGTWRPDGGRTIVLIASKPLPTLTLMIVSQVASSSGLSGSSVRIIPQRVGVADPQQASSLSRSVLGSWDFSQTQMENKTHDGLFSKQQYTFISLHNNANDYKCKPPGPWCWKMMKSMFGMALPQGHSFQHMSARFCEHN